MYSNFERTQNIFEKIPKDHSRFYVNIRIYTQYMNDFFVINEILSELMTIYTLYQENLSHYSLMLS
jgi:hypothetical protein